MADKNYSLKVDVEGASDTLQLAIERLEKIQTLKADIAKQVEVVSDADIKKITELGKSLEQTTAAEKKQKEVVDEHAKALERLTKAQQAEAIELEGLKVLTQQQNKENKEAAKEALGLTTEYEKQSKQLAQLKKEAKSLLLQNRELTKSEQDLVKATQELDKKLKEIDKSVGDNQRNVGDYRGQLKLLQKELQGLEPGTAQFNEAAKRAGELKDRIKDAAEATNAFATGSKLEQFGNIFKAAGSDILKLDFAGAAEKARTLVAVTKTITFKEALGGLKDLGSSIFNLGKALLTNPLFLIGGAIVGIGVALFKLKDNIPLVGKAFDFIGDTISFVTGKLKEFLDYLGISNFAEKKASENSIKFAKSAYEARKKYYDQEIAVLSARGKDTTNLERQKYKELQSIASKEISRLRDIQEFGNSGLNDDERAALREFVSINEDAKQQLRLIEANFQREQEEKAEKAREKREAEQKKEYEDALSAAEKQSNELLRIKLIDDKKEADRRKKEEELDELAAKQSIEFARKVSKEMLEELIEANEKAEKERLAIISDADKVASAIGKGLEERSKKNIEALAEEEKAADKSLALQEKRAADGLANTLESEQEKAARIEIEKEKQAKKDQRREKVLTFYSLLSGYAKDPGTSPSQALLKAGKDMAIAEGISLAFAERGGVGEDLKDTTTLKGATLTKSHKSGDILTVISPNEGILNENQMAALGGKKGFYNLTTMLENPISDDIMFPAVPEFKSKKSAGIAPLVREMREVKQAVENIKISNSYIDNAGNVITENINAGFKKITKKISQKPSFRR